MLSRAAWEIVVPAPGYEVLAGYVGLRALSLFLACLLSVDEDGVADDDVRVGVRYQGDSGFGALPEASSWCGGDGVALDEAWFG